MMEKATLTREDIIKYINKNKIFRRFTVRELKSGLANRNYLIESDGQKYNLRTNRLRPPLHKENLRNEYLILEFLKENNIFFVSESVYYDPEENIHIVRFIPGRMIQMRHMKGKKLKIVLEYLYRINRLAPLFERFIKKRKINFKPPKKYNYSLAKRLEPKIKGLAPDKIYREYLLWVDNKLQADLESLKIEEKDVYLNHGDPVSNIIIQGNKIFLIDWEQVKFSYDVGLPYIFTHGFISLDNKDRMINIYSRLAGIDKKWLREQTYKKYKQMLLEHIVLLCRVHARNRRLYDSPAPIDSEFIRDRMDNYTAVKI